jgi:uncharacterized membrane-anchored protein
MIYLFRLFRAAPEAQYWIIIVMIPTTGTDMGDFFSGHDGLGMGFGWAAALTGVLLVCSVQAKGLSRLRLRTEAQTNDA